MEQVQDNRFYREKLAPADYVFSLEEMEPTTGLYSIIGITTNEATVEDYLDEIKVVKRVQVFIMGQLEGPIQTITSIEEFMEFQK